MREKKKHKILYHERFNREGKKLKKKNLNDFESRIPRKVVRMNYCFVSLLAHPEYVDMP